MDEKLQTLLNNQVISEYGASMVYTQLAFEMDNLSFPGMRDWFMGQAAEERVHAEKIADHLLSRGYRVELNDIPVGSVKAANPQDAFQASLEHEQKVSEEIRTIARAALEELLLPHFACVEDEPVEDSLPVFAGKERWMVWRRR